MTTELSIPRMLNQLINDCGPTPDEMAEFIRLLTIGEIHLSQLGAFLMAIRLKGLPSQLLASMTKAMVVHSDKLNWDAKSWSQLTVDKHSTGGIGDKTSHILAPMMAAFGLKVPMISGRGLGITGGTIDKLESIAGYSDQLSSEQIDVAMEKAGCMIMGQTENLAPADRLMYKIRDVTATVDSIPLIAASIMSKKLCEGIKNLILDVKVGEGMFMTEKGTAIELSNAMIDIGRNLNLNAIAILTDMSVPIGKCSGNALEMAEVFSILSGSKMDPRMDKLVHFLAGNMLYAAGLAGSVSHGVELSKAKLKTNEVRGKMREMLVAHGVGDNLASQLCSPPNDQSSDPINYYAQLMGHQAPFQTPIVADTSGFVEKISAYYVGMGNITMGCGRSQPSADIDRAVGFQVVKTLGMQVQKGDTLAIIHHRYKDVQPESLDWFKKVFKVGSVEVDPTDIIIQTIQTKS